MFVDLTGKYFVPLTVGDISVVDAQGDTEWMSAHKADDIMLNKLKIYLPYNPVDVREILLPDSIPPPPYETVYHGIVMKFFNSCIEY